MHCISNVAPREFIYGSAVQLLVLNIQHYRDPAKIFIYNSERNLICIYVTLKKIAFTTCPVKSNWQTRNNTAYIRVYSLIVEMVCSGPLVILILNKHI